MSVKDATQAPQFLDWRARPEDLKRKITSVFNELGGAWTLFNGTKNYNLCRIDDSRLVDRIVEEAPSTKKEFYFLDIGAGNFDWGKNLAAHLASKSNLPNDVTFHIISIRGEHYKGPPEEIHGPCKIYNVGPFCIENLEEEFPKRLPQLPLHQRVDLAVSHYSFRHFVDPLGTFLQAYQLIRPEGGIFAFDGFFFQCGKDFSRERVGVLIATLLCEINDPFLMLNLDWAKDGAAALPQFILKRTNSTSPQLPYQYNGFHAVDSRSLSNASETVTHFERTDKSPPKREWIVPKNSFLSGDRDLYEWLKQKVGFGSFGKCLLSFNWGPLLKHQQLLEPPLIHQDIVQGNTSNVLSLLEKGFSIDESDQDGNTPLQIAILENDFPLFQLLLEKRANPLLANANKDLPLHLAAKQTWGAPFLRHLLENGIISANQDTKGYTALDDAIEAGAQECADLLRSHGGKTLEELNDEFDFS